ncbi:MULTISPECIES: hypothetical protein [Leptospira]|uniref:Uncharacterized protein n=6 Tax=Leptospira santarosai TaxID=28183 RepID=A0AB73M9M3_9LEPT|nr:MULTISPECIES: hypothetical protein [Leptospira]EMO58994.1 hypothetical protein LEP1GSC161_2808 [Leptospira santarosai str. CBC1416]AVV51223.1 Uncharacterized protein XB17_02644 [Leptospira santarosai]AVV78556.1 Uncharacterized protein XB15_00766 [Leptospira santarosai]EKO32315.1 hypothetical protein LEP1GSC179_1415 [Leptospira santarosai str. MOR084]EKO78613.1 hypothetical protein LEP1GSC068_2159 [Leptospira sp. Fiocruz LV3954]
MEKIRLGVYAFGVVIVGILVFTLSKSWFILDRGVELVESGSSKEEPPTPADRSGDLLDHSVILWERYLFYPFELSRETVAGHRKNLNHARNLTVIDLESGNHRKLFNRNVYIWDYFTGIGKEREIRETTEEVELDSVLVSGISTGKNLILIGMTEDTNKDGFLNQRDRKQVFVYNPIGATLVGILPRKYSLEKFLPSSGKEKLVMVVSLEKGKEESKKKKSPAVVSKLPEITFYIYDIRSGRGILIERP